ncbi:MAG: pyridoxal-phosphate dependent enzyme, partial [bacterium]|nr:pyridoxal-phosphate dependent enzyme [bacterium]
KKPRMMGFEALGAAPIYFNKKIDNPQTIATAIRIGNPASWDKAVKAKDESFGEIGVVSDEEIIEAYRILASSEGIFAEPASAAALAGVLKKKDELRGVVVCVITGHGLKDPEFPKRFEERIEFEPDAIKVAEFISKEI